MNKNVFLFLLITILIISCKPVDNENSDQFLQQEKDSIVVTEEDTSIKVVGAMRDVMWQGQLDGRILLDTLRNRKGVYGIGPLAGLRGEILLLDGEQYVSRVTETGTPLVTIEEEVTAPFFVYGYQNLWETQKLPKEITNLKSLEKFVTDKASATDQPFVFKLSGRVMAASYHIQNLAVGSKVTNPTEAHAGQRSFNIENEEVIIVGFYSKNHKGIFTHHDTNMHLHIITVDKKAMGHLDQMELDAASTTLFLPEF
jgi:acetolactate decarboxylase